MQHLRRQFLNIATLVVLLALPLIAVARPQPTLYYLDISGRILTASSDGTHVAVVAKDLGSGPDGIVIDGANRHLYWTSMGKASANDGKISRIDFDGTHLTTIVPAGGTFTPKQLKIDLANRKLYWSDREGMRVMRANMDGSDVEALIVTGTGEADRKNQANWCVGIALDIAAGKIYWTQKGGDNAHRGTIKRANLDIPKGEDAAHRSDVEVLFAGLPEPIDMDLDLKKRVMYWTDRGDNTVSRAPMDNKANIDPNKRTDREILVTGLHEAIGIALDLRHNQMYYTALHGDLGTAKLNGKDARTLLSKQGTLTGIALLDSVK